MLDAWCDDEINTLMIKLVNPVIIKPKKYLDENGNNTMNEFVSFAHSNIELVNADLLLKSDTMSNIKLNDLKEHMRISFTSGSDDMMRYTWVIGYKKTD